MFEALVQVSSGLHCRPGTSFLKPYFFIRLTFFFFKVYIFAFFFPYLRAFIQK